MEWPRKSTSTAPSWALAGENLRLCCGEGALIRLEWSVHARPVRCQSRDVVKIGQDAGQVVGDEVGDTGKQAGGGGGGTLERDRPL